MTLAVPPPKDDSPELNYSPRPQLVQIDAGRQFSPVVGAAVPHETHIASGAAGPAPAVTAGGKNSREIGPRDEAPHRVSAQIEHGELHDRGDPEIEPKDRRLPPVGGEQGPGNLIEQRRRRRRAL